MIAPYEVLSSCLCSWNLCYRDWWFYQSCCVSRKQQRICNCRPLSSTGPKTKIGGYFSS
ncbi:hypothetical protein RHMOL_Rhmol09G0110000 [Rhododendron molle]|uniref:Uncharacterized protein n=1 Tax=Rhododendron molle TaxID=49168 RepID=A0ACC0MD70_RHOML|nr:hypothetical protein RHMOL_Rhmol09G0110000 [Rhododendron molle]